jgi:hypothetical protein
MLDKQVKNHKAKANVFFKRILLILGIFPLCILTSNAQPLPVRVGQPNLVTIKLPSQDLDLKCNINVSFPGNSVIQKEVTPPNFETQVEIIPQIPGPVNIQWKGALKVRGINSLLACSGDGTIELIASLDPQVVAKQWESTFSKMNSDQLECVKTGLEINQLKYQSIDPDANLTGPDDTKSKQIFNKCDSFLAVKTLWGSKNNNPESFPCNIQTNIKTICEGVYAEKLSDGKLVSISKTQAIQLHFENKPWTTGQRENAEGKQQRAKSEEDQKARQQDELLAKKEAEEKERKFRESPGYKKQQEEIAKKQLLEEKEAEKRRLIEEKEQLAKAKKDREDTEKRRVAEEKEQFERDKRQKFEMMVIRPLMSQQDPRITCQSKLEFDTRLQPIASKISLIGLGEASFPMLSDQSLANAKEQQAISLWADEYKKCINESLNFRSLNYSKEMNVILEKEDTSFIEVAIELYGKKISFGNYNQKTQNISKETKKSLDSLVQQIKNQEDAARSRAAAIKDAQIRQDQQRIADQRRQEQAQQAERVRVANVRRQWEARCDFDKKNAYDNYIKSKERDCISNNRGAANLCALGVVLGADDYAKSAFLSCMSGAP